MNDAARDKLLERGVIALEALAKLPSELKQTRATIAKYGGRTRDALHGVRDAVLEVRQGLQEAAGLAALGAGDDDEFGDLLADLPADTSHAVASIANAIADTEDFPDLPDLGDLAGGLTGGGGGNGASDAAAGGPVGVALARDGDANAAIGDASGTASGTTDDGQPGLAAAPSAPSDSIPGRSVRDDH